MRSALLLLGLITLTLAGCATSDTACKFAPAVSLAVDVAAPQYGGISSDVAAALCDAPAAKPRKK
jgi:hypothetical protein